MLLLDILNNLNKYVKLGVISQKDGDQGDSSQRDGLAYALLALLNAVKDHKGQDLIQGWQDAIKLHEAAPGLYRRSPDPTYWGHNPNNFSRDQHSVLRIAMGAMGDKKKVFQSLKMMAKRFAFHQNTHKGTDNPQDKWKVPDIMTPAEIGCAIRSLNLWPLFFVLVILDLFLLVDLLLRAIGLTHTWDSDNMMALTILYSYKRMCTPISWLAMKLYKRTDFMDRIKNYYSEANGANGIEPLYELYKKAYEDLT